MYLEDENKIPVSNDIKLGVPCLICDEIVELDWNEKYATYIVKVCDKCKNAVMVLRNIKTYDTSKDTSCVEILSCVNDNSI